MKILQKIQGLVVINDVPEEDVELTVDPPVEEQQKPAKKPHPPRHKTCCDKYATVFIVLILCLVIGLIIPTILMGTVFAPEDRVLDQRGYCYINASFKFSCGDSETSETCNSRGCCFENSIDSQPSCYHSEPSEYGYMVTENSIAKGKSSPLKLASSSSSLGNSESLELSLTSLQTTTPFGGDAWISKLSVERSGDDLLRLTLSSPGHEEGTLLKEDEIFSSSPSKNPKLEVVVSNINEAFNVTVYRTNTTEILFQTLYGPMIMGDGYMEITTTVPTSSIFGLGSRYSAEVNPLFDEYEQWTLNSKDTSFSERSLPGTHPFYIGMDSSGEAYGVLVHTSAPLQIGTVPAPGLTFRTVIGSFKIYIMAGPTPKDVSRQYTSIIRKPYLPPYWALGFHLCRTVPKGQQEQVFNQVTRNMTSTGLPYESDCLDARLAYPDAFSVLPEWSDQSIQELHNSTRKFLATSYPFIVSSSNVMNNSQLTNYLLKFNDTSSYYGNVSNAVVQYPDYMDENSFLKWMDASEVVTATFNASDGLLLLQNAPLNEAEIKYGVTGVPLLCSPEYPGRCCNSSGLDFPVDPDVDEPSDGSICWSVIHPALDDSVHLAHHNAYGMYHTKRVLDKLESIRAGTRQVLLSSSTHPGSGQFGGHYSEGFSALLEDQKRALLQTLEMGLAGVPMTGTPPCGSRDGFDITENEKVWLDLCFRSYLNSLFSPFLLSHYELNQRSTNPTDVATGFAAQLKHYMMLRYMMLPTIYTLFVEARDTGAPVLRHLFYEFPEDRRSWDIGKQFMLGSSILVVPNFVNESNSGSTTLVPAYFPPGRWHELLRGRVVADSENGTSTELHTTITDINLFARGGAIVFMQGNMSVEIRNAEDMRQYPFHLYVFVLNDTDSNGSLYYDDGTTSPDDESYTATRVEVAFRPAERSLEVTAAAVDGVAGPYLGAENHSSIIEDVTLFGLGNFDQVEVCGEEVPVTKPTDNDVSALVNINWIEKEKVTITWQ
ncbi:P-type trefoil domain [Trinorchestia longiramus]|nr:P-type trefoil domain [Trinorchestia longiramus]